ncbi:poly [ADP-ribose] polymerase 2-like isoform X2 [Dysidea avara]|uniref:poly [ADP-ribose] polymerase 2-like isoform X2 n=1 Tax=Dysidea avara TaxID=196820 RepID=UPI00331FAA51
MSHSRKRNTRAASSSSASGEEESKRNKSDVTWEWHADSGWKPFTSALAQKLTDAFKAQKADVILKVSGAEMKVVFADMEQRNTSTGYQRDIRCTSEDPSITTSEVWEWEDEGKTWHAYKAGHCRLLEAAKLCDLDEVSISSVGRDYTVDLKRMVQINDESKTERNVRRIDTSSSADWQWMDEHGTWHDYDATISHKIESLHSAGSGGTVDFSVFGRRYEADVTAMQQINKDTNVKRNIRRQVKATAASLPVSSAVSSAPAAFSSSSSNSVRGSSRAGKSTSKAKEDDTDGTTVVFKGKAPVDSACTQKLHKAHVYCEGDEVWDAMLNQTNVKNNNNKFYIIQLLEDNDSRNFSVWFHWGRVGLTGQNTLTVCGTDLERAKNIFKKKFSDKTCNSWEQRDNFVKQSGKYDLIAVDYEAAKEDSSEEDVVDAPDDGSAAAVKSQLDVRLQSLIELICNVKEMEEAVIEMKYDTKKAPLGKLTKGQIKAGYAALQKIEACINKGKTGDALVQACDEFYTRIPHNFGMRRPPILRTKEEVKQKIALLEALGDIEIAMKVLSDAGSKSDIHPVDRHYQQLGCKMEPLDHSSEMFKLIEKYVQQTHAKTHNMYTMVVKEVIAIERGREAEQFQDHGNKMLLWHGSRLTNWVGILSQGLRIAPPEAPVTGYMFGKGIYFADMCSKSANYCFATRAKNEGLVLLSEVSLGHSNNLLAADYSADKLPRGKHSTKGLGRIEPDPSQSHTLPDGVVVPVGTSKDTGVSNPMGYTLNYNEYVVYDPKQTKMRYLVWITFQFK